MDDIPRIHVAIKGAVSRENARCSSFLFISQAYCRLRGLRSHISRPEFASARLSRICVRSSQTQMGNYIAPLVMRGNAASLCLEPRGENAVEYAAPERCQSRSTTRVFAELLRSEGKRSRRGKIAAKPSAGFDLLAAANVE